MRAFARFFLFFCLSIAGRGELHADNEGLPKLIVYGDSAAPHDSPDGAFQPTAHTFHLVNAFLAHSGLEYEFAFMPWPRALREVQSSSNGVIFALLRMPDRETGFHWILSLTEAGPMRLFTRKGEAPDDFLAQNKVQWSGTAACEKAAAQCMALEEFGFPQERILLIPEARDGAVEQMVLRGRADFMAGFDDAVSGNLARLGYAPDALVQVATLNNVPDYLAAPKSLNARLLERLMAASKTFDWSAEKGD